MRKILLFLPFLVMGCSQEAVQLLTPEYKVIKAPDELYNCPIKNKFPKSDTLTNKQVGTLILDLQKNNITCHNSMEAVKQFYLDVEQTVAKK